MSPNRSGDLAWGDTRLQQGRSGDLAWGDTWLQQGGGLARKKTKKDVKNQTI